MPALGIGGLPKLFEAMNQAFRFTEVAPATLEKQPVYRLRGEFNATPVWHIGCPIKRRRSRAEADRRLDEVAAAEFPTT